MDFLKIFAASMLWYPLFLIPAVFGFVTYYFVIKGASKLTKINWATIIAPWLIWLILMSFFSTGKKSLANLIEPVILGGIVSVLFIVWALMKKHSNVSGVIGSATVFVASCASAFLLFFLVPGLPE
jgi:uncharacterized membrane-anchored protein